MIYYHNSSIPLPPGAKLSNRGKLPKRDENQFSAEVLIISKNTKHIIPPVVLIVLIIFALGGCTDESPDTSAPERIEIDRSEDWHGALLYIADGNGPVAGWGSVRIFDNVSGFVEATVEQTMAASPSDLYVNDRGNQMYVSSMANGVVDLFFWDGNGWHRGTSEIETPAKSLLAIEAGPDQLLYLAGSTPAGDAGAIYKLSQEHDDLLAEPVIIPGITEARGIAWSEDKTSAIVTGSGPGGPSLTLLAWPAAAVTGTVNLPVELVNQPQTSPDGKTLFVACRDRILTADPKSGAITGSLAPSSEPGTDYYDVAFSADGRFLFAPGTPPGGDTTLFVIDLSTGSTVSQITHVSIKANGIKRTE